MSGSAVQIGTIISLAGSGPADEITTAHRGFSAGAGVFPRPVRPVMEILGRSLLERTKIKAREFTGRPIHVVPESPGAISVLPSRSAKTSSFIAAWESAVAHYVGQGIEQLLLLRVGSYSDLDFNELLQFHLERDSRLTQAYGPAGALDIAMVSTAALRDADGSYRRTLASLIPRQERFFYRGYMNPLRSPRDLSQLVEDGLNRRCGFEPIGDETAPGIWIGPGAQIKETVAITGPAFIGTGTRIADCCVLGGATSVERGCEIDCGTSVQHSCILQNSYVGVALELNSVVVNRGRLFHLDREIELEIADRRLISGIKGSVFSPIPSAGQYGVH